MGTGTWVLINAACVLSSVQQQGSVSIFNVTKRLLKSLIYNDKTFMKQFVTKPCLTCLGVIDQYSHDWDAG